MKKEVPGAVGGTSKTEQAYLIQVVFLLLYFVCSVVEGLFKDSFLLGMLNMQR